MSMVKRAVSATINIKGTAYSRESNMTRSDARRNAFLSVDGGKSQRMNIGDVATIKRSPLVTQLVRLKKRSFFDVINTKFKNA